MRETNPTPSIVKYLSSFLPVRCTVFSLISVNSGFLMSLNKAKHRPGFGSGALCILVPGAVMNLKQLTYKLQAALNQRGEHYKVNQLQHYSERLGRMVTKYVLEKAETDEIGKHISTRVLETYSMADVVKTLAKIYSG